LDWFTVPTECTDIAFPHLDLPELGDVTVERRPERAAHFRGWEVRSEAGQGVRLYNESIIRRDRQAIGEDALVNEATRQRHGGSAEERAGVDDPPGTAEVIPR